MKLRKGSSKIEFSLEKWLSIKNTCCCNRGSGTSDLGNLISFLTSPDSLMCKMHIPPLRYTQIK